MAAGVLKNDAWGCGVGIAEKRRLQLIHLTWHGAGAAVGKVSNAVAVCVEAGAEGGVGLADPCGELVKKGENTAGSVVLEQDGVGNAGGVGELQDCAWRLPCAAAIHASA